MVTGPACMASKRTAALQKATPHSHVNVKTRRAKPGVLPRRELVDVARRGSPGPSVLFSAVQAARRCSGRLSASPGSVAVPYRRCSKQCRVWSAFVSICDLTHGSDVNHPLVHHLGTGSLCPVSLRAAALPLGVWEVRVAKHLWFCSLTRGGLMEPRAPGAPSHAAQRPACPSCRASVGFASGW